MKSQQVAAMHVRGETSIFTLPNMTRSPRMPRRNVENFADEDSAFIIPDA